jgi:hypothetical protein
VAVFSNKIRDPVLAIVWGKRLRLVQVLCNQPTNRGPVPSEDLVFVDICDFMLEKAVKGITMAVFSSSFFSRFRIRIWFGFRGLNCLFLLIVCFSC